MNIETYPVNAQTLVEYSTIPMKYEVESKLSVELLNDGLEGIVFSEEEISPSYIRDFDAFELDTGLSNQKAVRLYKRLGYEIVDEGKQYYLLLDLTVVEIEQLLENRIGIVNCEENPSRDSDY